MIQKHPSESVTDFLAIYGLGLCLLVLTIGAAKTLGSVNSLAWVLGLIAVFSTRFTFVRIAKQQRALLAVRRDQDTPQP